MDDTGTRKGKRGLFDGVFPREYDFEDLLLQQAQMTVAGLRRFLDWMQTGEGGDPVALMALEKEVDKMRHDMEAKLTEAFSTPFDRQEIYGVSRQMDYILNFAVETAREMHAFGLRPDDSLLRMSRSLLAGTEHIADGVRMLSEKDGDFEALIQRARGSVHEIEEEYIGALARLFEEQDLRMVIKRREVYHHMRDAGRALRTTADVLHRAKVDIF
jgi:uncharacterized protein Yka (UPF0111/DUF47 family)